MEAALMGSAMQAVSGMMFGTAAFGVLVLGYFFIFWDRRKEDSANKDDGQVGIKHTLMALMLVGLGIVAGGVDTVVGSLLSGNGDVIKAGIKGGLANLIAGAVAFGGILFLFLPRTNSKDYPQAERFAAGAVAAVAGVAAIFALQGFLSGLFGGTPWAMNAGNLSSLLVYGALGVIALSRFGGMSGWAAPTRAPAGFPPQGGGYPPQGQGGGGYPPQGGGYPPQGQGGGYPPQGGGYPPQGQGGGYPPQGGGYPPQGGGGLPPPQGGYSGGGYQG
jgi:hypothetical protein